MDYDVEDGYLDHVAEYESGFLGTRPPRIISLESALRRMVLDAKMDPDKLIGRRIMAKTPKKALKAKATKVAKEFNRFYIGTSNIADNLHNNSYTHATIDDAVADAQGRLEDEPDLDVVIVVQIVRVVRRAKAPITVEVVG